MYCQKCGTQLDADAQFCKSCGRAMGTTPCPARPMNTLALLSLVLSICVPIAGLVVSVIARKQCIERGEDGEKLAKAGIIIGAVYCALIIAMIAILILARFMLF